MKASDLIPTPTILEGEEDVEGGKVEGELADGKSHASLALLYLVFGVVFRSCALVFLVYLYIKNGII